MHALLGRTPSIRTSCRCPSCSPRLAPRQRRSAASIAQHICSSTTGFAVSFSTAVAGASLLDARAKQKRRAEVDAGLEAALAEVKALRDNQEERLRKLGLNPQHEGGLEALDERIAQEAGRQMRGKETAARDWPSFEHERNIYQTTPLPCMSRSAQSQPTIRPNRGLQDGEKEALLKECGEMLADMCAKPMDSSPRDAESLEDTATQHNSHEPTPQPQSTRADLEQEAWKSQPDGKKIDRRVALQLAVIMSRLIYQFRLLALHLGHPAVAADTPADANLPAHASAAAHADGAEYPKEAPFAMKWLDSDEVHCQVENSSPATHTQALDSQEQSGSADRNSPESGRALLLHTQKQLYLLELIFNKLQTAKWQHGSNNKMAYHQCIDEAQEELAAENPLIVRYSTHNQPEEEALGQARQEDEILELFKETNLSASSFLHQLADLLVQHFHAPNIHTFNILIIKLCDRGLPAAARLVLETLRRSFHSGNAATHEAVLRCALTDQDEWLFAVYHGNMNWENAVGYHIGYHSTTHHIPHPNPPEGLWRPRGHKQLQHRFATPWYLRFPAEQTPSTTETVIRNYLRARRIGPALRAYHRLLQTGHSPSSLVLGSFLRYCFVARDVPLARELWKHVHLAYPTPPSSAFYWMLAILARPWRNQWATAQPKQDRLREEEQDCALFEQISAELATLTGQPYPISRWAVRSKIVHGRRWTRLLDSADEIEDFSVRQWVPGNDPADAVLPDVLSREARAWWEGRHRDMPVHLEDYIQLQHAWLRHWRGLTRIETLRSTERFLVVDDATPRDERLRWRKPAWDLGSPPWALGQIGREEVERMHRQQREDVQVPLADRASLDDALLQQQELSETDHLPTDEATDYEGDTTPLPPVVESEEFYPALVPAPAAPTSLPPDRGIAPQPWSLALPPPPQPSPAFVQAWRQAEAARVSRNVYINR